MTHYWFRWRLACLVPGNTLHWNVNQNVKTSRHSVWRCSPQNPKCLAQTQLNSGYYKHFPQSKKKPRLILHLSICIISKQRLRSNLLVIYQYTCVRLLFLYIILHWRERENNWQNLFILWAWEGLWHYHIICTHCHHVNLSTHIPLK